MKMTQPAIKDIKSCDILFEDNKSWGSGSKIGDMAISADGHLWNMHPLPLDAIEKTWSSGGYEHDFCIGFKITRSELEDIYASASPSEHVVLYTGFYKLKSLFKTRWIGFQKVMLKETECHIGWFSSKDIPDIWHRIHSTIDGNKLPFSSGPEALEFASST